MSQFSRRARWLNALFPASVAPTVRDPNSRSDDVSLVQPYDASGWPFTEPENWITVVDGVAGAISTTDILTVPDGQVYRLLAASAFMAVVPSGSRQLFIRDRISTPNSAVKIADDLNAAPDHGHFHIRNPIIVPAGLIISGDFAAGGAGSVPRWNLYGVLAPEGTVFYC